MKTQTTSATDRFLGLVAAVVVAAALVIAVSRTGHPLPLAPFEGETLSAVARLVEGLALQVEPSLEFVDPTPAPLYHGAAAIVARETGIDFLAPRLVALLFAAGVLVLAFAIVRRVSGRALGGLSACALLVVLETDLDLAQPESTLIFLMLGAVGALTTARGGRSDVFVTEVLAACLTAALWLAHPPAAPVAAAGLCLGAIFTRPRHGLVFLVTLTALLAFGAWHLATEEAAAWLAYHAFEVPRNLALDARTWMGPTVARSITTLCVVWLACAWTAAAGTARGDRVDPRRDACRFVAVAVLGVLAAAWVLRPQDGAALACLHALLALCAGLAVDALATRWAAAGRLGLAAAVIFQLLLLRPDPRGLIPAQDAAEAARRLEAEVAAAVPPVSGRAGAGELLAPFAPWLPARLGHPPHASYEALLRLRRADPALGGALLQELRGAVVARRYAAILWLDDEPPSFITDTYAVTLRGDPWCLLTAR